VLLLAIQNHRLLPSKWVTPRELKRAAHKNAMFTITNIIHIPLTGVIVYCTTLIGVNKVVEAVETRRDVIKYLHDVN